MNISLGRCQRLGRCGFLDCICDMDPTMRTPGKPFDHKAFADFKRAIAEGKPLTEGIQNAYAYDEQDCPGHVASKHAPKVCDHCGVHIDSLRPLDDAH